MNITLNRIILSATLVFALNPLTSSAQETRNWDTTTYMGQTLQERAISSTSGTVTAASRAYNFNAIDAQIQAQEQSFQEGMNANRYNDKELKIIKESMSRLKSKRFRMGWSWGGTSVEDITQLELLLNENGKNISLFKFN